MSRVKITNMNDGKLYDATISSMACKESVINMINEHRLLIHKQRARRLTEKDLKRMSELNDFLLLDCLEDLEEVGVLKSPFGKIQKNTTILTF